MNDNFIQTLCSKENLFLFFHELGMKKWKTFLRSLLGLIEEKYDIKAEKVALYLDGGIKKKTLWVWFL